MFKIKQLEKMLSQGKLSRREFLARASALGLTSLISPALLTASARAMAPKKGGRLRMGLTGGSTTDSLDPAVIEDIMPMIMNCQIRNSLTEVEYGGKLVPELAESWDTSPDASKWIFKLRKGIEFHNGKTLDAEDVVFSINHHRKEGSKSRAKVITDPIKDIKADGKFTVVFTLNDGNADFGFLMSDFHLTIQPAGTINFDDGIGTGGYILQRFEPGVSALTKRNPNYWKEGRAHFDEVEILSIADIVARTNALVTGQVDVINRCDTKTVHLLEKAPSIQVVNYSGTRHYTFPMRTDMAPFDNNDVRLAMKYAINRDHLLKAILMGYGYPGNDHPISRSNRYYASELSQRKYDPDKAKFHIKKAGMQDHIFKLHVAEAGFPGAVDAAVLYKEHASKAGINIKIVREPNDGYWSNIWKKVPWCACYWSGRPTEDWMFSWTYAAGAKQNDTFWKHDRFNELLKEARSELDEKKRREKYVDMQSIVRDEGGAVIPMFANNVEAATTKLKLENPMGNWELDGLKLPERWWFES